MPPRSDPKAAKSTSIEVAGTSPSASPQLTPKSFEKGIAELEAIVQELERGELSLEDSILLFEKGIALSSSCREQLAEAETRVEMLLRRDGKMVAEPFAPAAGTPAGSPAAESHSRGASTLPPATGTEAISDDDIPF